MLKPCLACRCELALDQFSKNARKRDGLDSYCKRCTAVRSAEAYRRNRNARREQTAAWLAANPGKSAAYSKRWRDANPGAQAASERRWYERNREQALVKDREQRLARLDAAQQKDRERYWANREQKTQSNREWAKNNPGRVAAYAAARRAAKALRTPEWLTAQDWAAIFAVYEQARRLTAETGVLHHVDHEIPLRGRTVSGLHVPSNLRCLEATLNLMKNNRAPSL